jgi:hypothetical protein
MGACIVSVRRPEPYLEDWGLMNSGLEKPGIIVDYLARIWMAILKIKRG